MLSYTPEHREVAFPLGGVGTGNVSLGARGELRDWELFNRPGKGNTLPCTFFCLRYQAQGRPPQIRMLESKLLPPYGGPNGWRTGRNEIPGELGGVPRFAHSRMQVEYPFAQLSLWDDDVPLRVELEAFTPFVPLNLKDSSIPCALFSYRVTNTSEQAVQATVAATLLNCVGHDGGEPRMEAILGNRNRLVHDGERTILLMEKPGQDETCPEYGTLALSAMQTATAKTEWVKGQWWDGVQEFWDDLLGDGRLQEPADAGIGSRMQAPPLVIGSLAVDKTIAPGATEDFTLALAWHFPNRMRGWWANRQPMPVIRNQYATYFADAADAAGYALEHLDRLRRQSRQFTSAFASATMPETFRNAAMRNLATQRSPTMFVVEGGRLMGWEGCLDREGSCHGTCTHVYNYAQSMAALFPELERSTRQAEFTEELDDAGAMSFRSQTGFGWPRFGFAPAIDGQFGAIVRLCREWRRSTDDGWLAGLWPGVRRALDFGISHWDPDGDGLPEAEQHNTYDIEFHGPNPLGASMMLAGLRAGIAMARAMGDEGAAQRWQARLELGAAAMCRELFNGSYYMQPLEEPDRYKYQPGAGCLSDQLMGQFLADCVGLGDILPPEQMRTALRSIVRYNFIEDFQTFPALHRSYALPGEQGLVLCTWPLGERPAMPMAYSDEVWSGVEYEVAALLARHGMKDQALRLVQAVNDRHDGIRRNPFNEAECGHHYARSMASWALLDACSGFQCDLPGKELRFEPTADGRYFFACGQAWGVFVCQDGISRIELYGGDLQGVSIRCPGRFAGVINQDA